MASRSVRHREARRRTGGATGVVVTVELTDFATGISGSFLIMPGTAQATTLTGIIYGGGGDLPRVLKVPLKIRAHAA